MWITLTDFSFLLRSAPNCKNCYFLDNLRTITQEGNMETRQMTPFFSSSFSALTVCNIHFYIWKYSKFIFMWSILVCKISQFWAKATDSNSPSYFSRKKTLRLLKIHIMFCPPGGVKKGSNSWNISLSICF